MTQSEAATRVKALLETDWHSVGQLSRFLGVPRSSVEKEIRRMKEEGRVESRVQRFFRNGDWRTGETHRLAEPIECGPSFREQVQAIIDEEWADEFKWMRPSIASATDDSVSVVFFDGGWDEFESVTEARRQLHHMAQIEKKR